MFHVNLLYTFDNYKKDTPTPWKSCFYSNIINKITPILVILGVHLCKVRTRLWDTHSDVEQVRATELGTGDHDLNVTPVTCFFNLGINFHRLIVHIVQWNRNFNHQGLALCLDEA